MSRFKKVIFFFALMIGAANVQAKCAGGFINIITDISWQCMFPINLAGMAIGSGEDTVNQNRSATCVCNRRGVPSLGLRYSLWEPSRLIDTVSDPYCMVALGTTLNSTHTGKLGGGLTRSAGSTRAFQQMHFYIFPVFQILDMFYDIPCIGDEGFDVAMMTEIVPTWNNDVMAMLLNPEAVLFGNPATNVACSADAIAALDGFPRPELFWCLGSWGNAYPLAGSITSTDYTEANAALAARGTYFMARSGLLWESSEDGCSKSPALIWSKDHYKMQMARPTRDSNCLPIGRDALLWGAGKHDMYSDNFLWVLNKKVNCCMTVY